VTLFLSPRFMLSAFLLFPSEQETKTDEFFPFLLTAGLMPGAPPLVISPPFLREKKWRAVCSTLDADHSPVAVVTDCTHSGYTDLLSPFFAPAFTAP